ncbi:MAG: filamentous hemagglutinin N-terminal domain-containing protein [Pseudomonadota bacterium]
MKRDKQTNKERTAFRLRPFSRALLQRFWRLQSKRAFARAGWGALAAMPGLTMAGPTGESVVAGNVNVARPNANATQINQTSQNAIVNWSTFSIGGDEFVLIQQPNSSSTILNRVIGSQQSTILGQLQANGRVFLVNPQGVYVGPNASLDVGALTLSALDIKDEDFLAGNYVFSGTPANGVVENAGNINAQAGGFVVLAGDYVNNTGVITATLGTVVLAAGEQVTLDIDNDGLVGFAVDEATVADLAGVENVGQIIADGGRVVMTASVANDLVATAVNNEGLVRAHRIQEQGGEIFLSGYGGDVINAGVIDAAGESGDGGRAIVYGDEDVVLEAGSQIIATGSGQSSGGTVRVIANGDLNFKRDAEISVGDRGFVELSGHEGLKIRGDANIGQSGTLLIDPAVLTIENDSDSPDYGGACIDSGSACVGKGFIEGQLNSGNRVVLVADTEIKSAGGPFTISASGSEGGGGSGTLEIRNAVVTSSEGGSVDCSFGVCFPGGGTSASLAPTPTGNINLSDVNINILGDFIASAGTSIGNVNLGSIRAGNVNITAGSNGGDINVGPTVATGSFFGSPSLALAAPGGGIGIAAASTDLNLTALGGDVNINGNVTLTGDSTTTIDIKADPFGGNININGDVMTTTFIGGDGTGDALIRMEARNTTVNGNITAVGPTGALIDIGGSNPNNINIAGTARAIASSGAAGVQIDGDGTVNVGGVFAQGSSAFADLRGGNLTFGAINLSAPSFASFAAVATNTLTANGLINITEGGGGLAAARFAGNLVTINGGINVNAGAGGDARIAFGSSEGIPVGNLVVNQQVVANGGASDRITLGVTNGARTNGNGLLRAEEIRIFTMGGAPNIDLDTRASDIKFENFGGAPNLILNNSSLVGPTNISFFSGAENFRSATFLTNNNINFLDAFTADNLLVGAPNGRVNFQAPVFITGANPVAPTATDLNLFQTLASRGLTPPGAGPSVQILGGNGINIQNPFVLGGPNPYIKLFSGAGFNTPGITTDAPNVLAAFNPINLASPVFFGDQAQPFPPGAFALFNDVNIQGLPDGPGTTVVIGERALSVPFLSGPVTIGPGQIDLGDRNMFIISSGQVTGDDLVVTNGIFEIIGLAATNNFFQIPIINEFDEVDNDEEAEEDDQLPIADGDGGGDDEGNITEESNSESMECAA